MPTRKNFRERRHKRQDEAKARQEARTNRSTEAQIALIKTRPGESKRELERIS